METLQQIIDSGLCNRCGTCVGLSDGNVVFEDRDGDYLPCIREPLSAAEEAGLLQVCSGKGFDFPRQRARIFGEQTGFHMFLGAYQSLSIGYAADASIRAAGASGGILSAVLVWLLDHQKIDGAVVLSMDPEVPWRTKPVIATTREQILDAAQSKYVISSVNEILPEMQAFDGRLAYVGLPGQVQAIRLLQEQGHPATANVRYVLGPFYGNTLHGSSIRSLLRSYGVYDSQKIRRVAFRHGEWPGKMRIELEDRVIELPKFHANYLIPFHILKNSLLCTDLTNEFTDISGGDAWAPVYEQRGLGFSMVIGRSSAGQSILDAMQADGSLALEPLDLDKAIEMHAHGYDLKKRGSFIRLGWRKALGCPVPDYGYTLGGFSLTRYGMELVIVCLFGMLGTRPARWLCERLPPDKLGRVFEWLRTAWKRVTRGIKRSRLRDEGGKKG